jgi:hypothetical protein
MAILTADHNLQEYLAPLREKTEIKDDNGKLLGVFIPAIGKVGDEIRTLFDPAEIKRRKEREGDAPGHTTDHVLAYLHSLEIPR